MGLRGIRYLHFCSRFLEQFAKGARSKGDYLDPYH